MFITKLPDFDYLEVAGPDSRSFLQGQLTCDVDKLTGEQAIPGAVCNLKGRVIANFILLQDGEACLLQCSAGTGEKLREALAKYAVFSKVEINLVPGPNAVYGAVGDGVNGAFAEIVPDFPKQDFATRADEEYRVLQVPGEKQCHQIWCMSEESNSRMRQLDVMEEEGELNDWKRQEILAGLVQVEANHSEEYTPQLLNYDLSGVIDFNKGCYTGQEVVARMFYRGKPKKRLYLLACESSIEEGKEIAISSGAAADRSAAEVLVSIPATAGEPSLALAILPTTLADGSETPDLRYQGKYSVEILSIPYTD